MLITTALMPEFFLDLILLAGAETEKRRTKNILETVDEEYVGNR